VAHGVDRWFEIYGKKGGESNGAEVYENEVKSAFDPYVLGEVGSERAYLIPFAVTE